MSASQYEVKAWIDDNSNGQWDAEEWPLPDVQIELRVTCGPGDCYFDPAVFEDYKGFKHLREPKFSIGQSGRALVQVGYACYGLNEIAATPPAGYRATTPQVQKVEARDGLSTKVHFGFKHEEQATK